MINSTWRDQLDEHQRKAVAFAVKFAPNYSYGAASQSDLVLIARLAALLDAAATPRSTTPDAVAAQTQRAMRALHRIRRAATAQDDENEEAQ